MKLKKQTILLLLVVLAIWGIVISKIVIHLKGDAPIQEQESFSVLNENTMDNLSDTFSLLPQTYDPFLGNTVFVKYKNSFKTTSVKNKNTSIPLSKKIESVNWPNITYSGMVQNSKTALAIIQINGNDKLMKAHQLEEGILLEKIFRDSIEVKMGKNKKIVKK